MYTKKLVAKDTYYIGASERRLELFENIYPLTNGVSYNSYVILDEKTCLLDTVDKSVDDIFIEKLEEVLDGRELDYLVVNHMEPDHSATIRMVVEKYPNVTVVFNSKIETMLYNFNEKIQIKNKLLVKEGDILDLGEHKLTFVFAPMVHWPEVMITYDVTTKTLFSADAFGTFGALSGNIFADEMDFHHEYLDDARRYYTNIVGKYGCQVQALLKKAAGIEIETICPLHGPIWRQDISYFVSLYDKWSRYEPEVTGVLIVYGSVYGHTAKVADLIADELSELGIKNIHMFDASKTDVSVLVSETFKYSHLVICSATYNMGAFTPIENYLLDLKAHNMQNRKVVVVENGSWAPNSGSVIKNILSQMKNMEIINNTLTIKSAIKEEQLKNIKEIADLIARDFPKVTLNENPLFKLTYGLYVLTTSVNGNDNGLIINTVSQVSENPNKLMVSINKKNYSAEILKETKKCNINILTKHTPFSIFKRFGFATGRDTNKFEGLETISRSSNDLYYLTKYTNAYISLEIEEVLDMGSHYVFIGKISESKQLSNEDSCTYVDYLTNIKPKPARDSGVKKGWICRICGYVYEGETLPEDYICPLCKHGVEDFEKLK